MVPCKAWASRLRKRGKEEAAFTSPLPDWVQCNGPYPFAPPSDCESNKHACPYYPYVGRYSVPTMRKVTDIGKQWWWGRGRGVVHATLQSLPSKTLPIFDIRLVIVSYAVKWSTMLEEPRWSSSLLSQSRLSQHFPSWNLGELGWRRMHSRIHVEGMKALSHWELHGEQGKLSWVSFGFWSEVCSEKAFRGNEKNAKKGCMLLVGQINLWVWSACLNDQTVGVDCSVQLEPYYRFKKLTWHIYLAPATCWPPYFQRSHLVEIKPALMEATPRK